MKTLVPHPELIVRGLISKTGMTREQFAEKVDITVPTLNRKLSRHTMFDTVKWRELVEMSKQFGGFTVEDLKEMGLKIRKEET